MPIDAETDERGHPEAPNSPLTPADASVYETPFGREDDHGSIAGSLAEQEIEDIPVDALPVGAETDIPDPGTTHETLDGLDETEEAVRHYAEDVPSGTREPL